MNHLAIAGSSLSSVIWKRRVTVSQILRLAKKSSGVWGLENVLRGAHASSLLSTGLHTGGTLPAAPPPPAPPLCPSQGLGRLLCFHTPCSEPAGAQPHSWAPMHSRLYSSAALWCCTPRLEPAWNTGIQLQHCLGAHTSKMGWPCCLT